MYIMYYVKYTNTISVLVYTNNPVKNECNNMSICINFIL